ncbi:T-box transcription factor mls-1-like [Uloborus diversus]|uniref:T-box transcription factor mls-1-like n=1 Tax=Uloborus diversus TaxID=327109 RepID=UPI002409152A|nr:T-box transcription factor mls-1-like [Uloborus diversus]
MSESMGAFLSEKAEAFSVDALLGLKTSKQYDGNTHISDRERCNSNNNEADVQLELIGRELWSEFHRLGNEMIITKCGRRIFPALKVSVTGLNPEKNYIMWIDVIPVDNLRYRYVYHSSRWKVAGRGEPSSLSSTYFHPYSPASGKHWMSQPITFDKVKLTNARTPPTKGKISLHSMHKYQPRFHIQEVTEFEPKPQANPAHIVSFIFPETQFITVTAYQNQQITRLKIASNPFAKGFREAARTSDNKDTNSYSSFPSSIFATFLMNGNCIQQVESGLNLRPLKTFEEHRPDVYTLDLISPFTKMQHFPGNKHMDSCVSSNFASSKENSILRNDSSMNWYIAKSNLSPHPLRKSQSFPVLDLGMTKNTPLLHCYPLMNL